MKSPFSLRFLLSILFLFFSYIQKTFSFVEKDVFQSETQCGEYSEAITAVHDQWTEPAQHFLCGYAVREMKWKKTLYNCNCTNRSTIPGVVDFKCDWCENTFYSMRNGFKAIFCSMNNWFSQITKTFETGNLESRNWKEVKCPPGFYVKQVAGKLGVEQETTLGFTGMQLVCSNLEQTKSVNVEDTTKHPLEQASDNRAGTFLSAVWVKYQKLGMITGMKFNFQGIAYIRDAEIVKFGEITGKVTEKTIEIVPLPTVDVQKKVKVPLSTTLTISPVWKFNNSYFYGYTLGKIFLQPPSFQMEKDEGLYNSVISRTFFNVSTSLLYQPKTPVYATINPFTNVTATTVMQKIDTNVSCTFRLKFYDKLTEEFIMEKIVEGSYFGSVPGPITINFEQKKCIGAWGKNNFITNGDFEQNKCTRSEGWCVWDQTSISNNLPGWIPNPTVQVGKGNMYSNVFADNWIVQLYLNTKGTCIKQKLNLSAGQYLLSFNRVARRDNPLSASAYEVKFDGNSLKKIYSEDYFLQKESIDIKLTEPKRDYWLQICGIGTGSGYSALIDNIKLELYNPCDTIQTFQY